MSPTIRIQAGAVEFARRYPTKGRFRFIVDGVRDTTSLSSSSSLADVLDYANRSRSWVLDGGVPLDVEVQFW